MDISKKSCANMLSEFILRKIDIISLLMKERDERYDVTEETKRTKESFKLKFFEYVKANMEL